MQYNPRKDVRPYVSTSNSLTRPSVSTSEGLVGPSLSTIEGQRPSLRLSDFGKIVVNEWNKSFEIRDELICDEYIIMPNHLHAIIILKKPKYDDSYGLDDTQHSDDLNDLYNTHDSYDSYGLDDSRVSDDLHDLDDTHVETHGRASLQQQRKTTTTIDDITRMNVQKINNNER
ncbi:hypothetical protein JXI42_02150 [bacterium]|nr:hypothetical protein [bacterium]